MAVIDISGPIYNGMWNYSKPLDRIFKDFQLSRVKYEYAGKKYTLDLFKNMKAQTGTYIESPGQYREGKKYSISDIPIENLFMIDAYVLQIPYENLNVKDGKRFVSLDELKKAGSSAIPEGSAILVGTGYGRYWQRKNFFEKSWFFKREAIEYLMERRPFLIGADSAEWENPRHPEGIFKIIYQSNTLILAPCINLEKITGVHVKLTVLPLKVLGAFICPVRALVVE